jgi:hypothetical protein
MKRKVPKKYDMLRLRLFGSGPASLASSGPFFSKANERDLHGTLAARV